MAKRLITGFILAPILIWTVLFAPKPVFFVLLGLAAAQGVDELVRMYADIRIRDRVALVPLTLVTLVAVGAREFWLIPAVVPVAWLGWCLIRPGTVDAAGKRAEIGMLSLAYVATLFGVIVQLFGLAAVPAGGRFDSGRGAVLSLLIVVFCGDTGAYFAGRSLGRHKLYALISPKKTLEGALGGLLASIVGGAIAQRYLMPQLSVVQGVLLGASAGIVGQIGDLAESLFKRATGTKDSGGLLPGHGGILDRLDGVIFAAPVVLAWVLFH